MVLIGGVVRVDGERGAVIGVVVEVTVGNGEAAGLGAVEDGGAISRAASRGREPKKVLLT